MPEPDRFDTYSVNHIDDKAYGEDLTCELAVVNQTAIGNVCDPDGLIRYEEHGPALIREIADITKATTVKVTPVIHVPDYNETPVDAYEIPDYIRQHVILRSGHSQFPNSSVESRHLDQDHVNPWQPGQPEQTKPSNLVPLERKAHRAKTHAGWRLDQPKPGTVTWTTGAGQQIQVDHTGTQRIPARE